MPVYVQWKWEEKTKTYLVIFHFLDTFDKPNLRMKNVPRIDFKRSPNKIHLAPPKPTPIMTWAPSHPELGLLSEVLSYANIINGLDYGKKREIKDWLEGEAFFLKLVHPKKNKKITFLCSVTNLELLKASELCNIMPYSEEEERYYRCFKLTPEYIDYIKKGLKIVQSPESVKKTLRIDRAIEVAKIIPPEGYIEYDGPSSV